MTDRELDALVAEHVFGWKGRVLVGIKKEGPFRLAFVDANGNPSYEYRRYFTDDGVKLYCGSPYAPSFPGAWSTTGDGLLAVIEKMYERGFWVSVITRRIESPIFLAKVWNFEVEKSEAADTAPRAVAIAALRALGVEA